jgi:hypothetical protein
MQRNATTRHSRSRLALLLVIVVAASSFALVVGAAPAAAKSSAQPCWKRVLHDWFLDGRIDGTYPPKCLSEAMGHLPPDAKTYSNFQDEAKRALQQDERWQREHPHRKAHYTLGLPLAGGGKGGGGNGTGHGPNWGPGSLHPGDVKKDAAPGGAIGDFFTGTQPSDPSSIPVPLLVLGGIGILLLLAAAASLLARRLQARRAVPATAPATAPADPKQR